METAREHEFRVRLTRHVTALLPGSSGEAQVEAFVSESLQKARLYGFTGANDTFRFVNLMIRYGRDFDTDPALPFADRILEERMVYERNPLINRLEEVAP